MAGSYITGNIIYISTCVGVPVTFPEACHKGGFRSPVVHYGSISFVERVSTTVQASVSADKFRFFIPGYLELCVLKFESLSTVVIII